MMGINLKRAWPIFLVPVIMFCVVMMVFQPPEETDEGLSKSGEAFRNSTVYGSTMPLVTHGGIALDEISSNRRLCKICKKNETKSRLYQDYEETANGTIGLEVSQVEDFYDEEGYYHLHDPSIVKINFRCSLGHHYFEQEPVQECWCGWPNEETEQ